MRSNGREMKGENRERALKDDQIEVSYENSRMVNDVAI